MSLSTKPIEDVLKNAQEVTSLASTDKLAVIGEDGKPKKIATTSLALGSGLKQNVVHANAEWIRIASINRSARSSAFLLFIDGEWHNGAPCASIISFVIPASTDSSYAPTAKVLLGKTAFTFNKCRLVKEGNMMYIELYRINAGTSGLNLSIIPNQGNISLLSAATSNASSEDVVTEFSLLGGGKSLFHNKLRKYTERRWVA